MHMADKTRDGGPSSAVTGGAQGARARVTTSVTIAKELLDLLSDVAIVRAFGRRGQPSVSDVIAELITRHRPSLEREADKLKRIESKRAPR